MATKPSKQEPATQLALFEQVENLEHWNDVRKIEINNEMYYSVLDIFKFYGDSSNPTMAWKQALERMKKQGYTQTNDLLDYVFIGEDGKKKKQTPVASEKGFFRIAQATNFKHWEHIRDFMAQAAKEKNESARQKKQRETIEYMDDIGLGDTDGVTMLKAKYELNRGWKALSGEIFAKCENPKMGIIVNKEYTAVFGMVAEQLQKELNTKSIRDSLPLRQTQILIVADGMLHDILAQQDNVTNEQIYAAIELAIVPIGQYLRGISAIMGVSPVTGKPLLSEGEKRENKRLF